MSLDSYLTDQVLKLVGHDAFLQGAVGTGDPEGFGRSGFGGQELLGHGGAGGHAGRYVSGGGRHIVQGDS